MPRIFIVKHPICEPRPSAPRGSVCVYPWKTTKGHNRPCLIWLHLDSLQVVLQLFLLPLKGGQTSSLWSRVQDGN